MAEGETTTPTIDGPKLKAQGTSWMEKIYAAEKREKDWRDDAKAAEKAYSNDAGKDSGPGVFYDFNILHSNVETIVPAIYNSTPVPDVRRRYVEAVGDPPQDPTQQILMQAAQQQGIQPDQMQQLAQSPQGQQMAQQVMQSQPAQQEMMQFQQAMQAYQAKSQMDKDTRALGTMIERAIAVQIDDNKLDKEIESEAQDAFLSGRGIIRIKFDAKEIERDQFSEEQLQFEAVSWRDFRMGPATRWENVPWIAFRHVVSRETLEEQHTDKDMLASQANLGESTSQADDGDDVPFWEIWCKYDRTVHFVSEGEQKILKQTPDPLELKDFWPIPPIVQPITLTAKLTPVCPFVIYKKLADELDLCTKRINKIMKGLKVRALVAGSASKVIDLSTADDNEIIVESDLEGLAQIGLDKAVLWWPVEQAVKVLQQLYEQREEVKNAIYEITGISDIVRGASNANETLGAQEIKTKWGALRIQKMQRMIERQVRDLFSLMAEILTSGKFSEKTLQAMTGIEFTDGMRQLMSQHVLTSYRVDIESDSTVRADLTHEKAEMSEFLQGTAQYFAAMQPLVQAEPQMAKPVAEIYSSFASVYNLGKQAEDALDEMVELAKKAPQQDKPNPDQQKAEAEMKLKEQDGQLKQQAHEQTMTQGQQKHTAEMEKLAMEKDKAIREQQAGDADRVAQQNQAASDRVVQQQDMETQRTRDAEQHGFKREAHQQAMQKSTTEANAKRTEAGLPSDEAWNAIIAQLDNSQQVVIKLTEAVSSQGEQFAGAIETLSKALTAPKKIIKDKAGKPIGVETVQ